MKYLNCDLKSIPLRSGNINTCLHLENIVIKVIRIRRNEFSDSGNKILRYPYIKINLVKH